MVTSDCTVRIPVLFFFVKQKTAYEMRISDWSSDVCSSDLLARAHWLVIGDAQGQAKGARITAAAELCEAEIERNLSSMIEKRSVTHWNDAENRVEARIERRLGAITLASGPDPDPDPQELGDKLVEKDGENTGRASGRGR